MRYYVQMRAVKSRKVDLEKSQRQVQDQKRFEATSCSPIRLIMQHQTSSHKKTTLGSNYNAIRTTCTTYINSQVLVIYDHTNFIHSSTCSSTTIAHLVSVNLCSYHITSITSLQVSHVYLNTIISYYVNLST